MKNLTHYNNNWYDNLINLTTINNNNFALNISITKLSLFVSRLFHGLKIVLFSPCVIHENGFLLEEFGFLSIVDTREKKKNKNRGYSEILKVSHRFSILRENVLGGSRKKKIWSERVSGMFFFLSEDSSWNDVFFHDVFIFRVDGASEREISV